MQKAYLAQVPPIVAGFAHLLSHTRLAIAQDSPGLTWLELFLLSLSCTSQPDLIIQSSNARSAKH
eukprot:1092385-Karenia_brevis.AAC.1